MKQFHVSVVANVNKFFKCNESPVANMDFLLYIIFCGLRWRIILYFFLQSIEMLNNQRHYFVVIRLRNEKNIAKGSILHSY